MAHGLVMVAAAANAACDAIVDLLDASTPGHLVLTNSADTVLGQIPLCAAAFAAASGGVAALTVSPAVTVPIAVAGTIAKVYMLSGASTPPITTDLTTGLIFQGTVGTTSDYDMTVTNTVVGIGDNVSITSGTFTVPLS